MVSLWYRNHISERQLLNFKNSCVVGVIDRHLWYCEKVVTLLICRWFMLFVHKVHMKKAVML